MSYFFGFLFGAEEPIWKDGNNRKFKKPHFSGNYVGGVPFSWVRTDLLGWKSSNSSIWTDISLVGKNLHHSDK